VTEEVKELTPSEKQLSEDKNVGAKIEQKKDEENEKEK
jgi:hypothetical protein